MNREIKFRGQKLDSKEFVYGQLAYMFDDKNHALIIPSCYYATRDFDEEDENGNPIIQNDLAIGGFLSVKSETVGQFTSLHDKNGKEIYEGDIFDYHGIVNVVIFKDGMFCYDSYRENKNLENIVELSNYFFNWENNKSKEIEVIGNIYENPELLKN